MSTCQWPPADSKQQCHRFVSLDMNKIISFSSINFISPTIPPNLCVIHRDEMGRNPVFPKVQNDWIAAHIPKYIEKTAFGKPSIPGQPPAADDDDLLQWVRQCRDQFEVQFKSELDAKSNDSVVVNASSSGGASKGTGSAETFMESVRTVRSSFSLCRGWSLKSL